MATLNFKASAIKIEERSNSFDPLPAGEYEMMITKSATRPTKKGDGSFLELEMQVIGGQYSGRRHWERLNLDNPSQTTVKIAQEQLARLCMALGLDDVNDSEELHDTPFIAEIGIDKKDTTRNVIWGYQSAGVPTAVAKSTMQQLTSKFEVTQERLNAAASAKTARPWGA